MSKSNSSCLEEELESLQAIYCKPEEFKCWKSPDGQCVTIQFEFHLLHLDAALIGSIQFVLQCDYPLTCPKEMTVLCDYLPQSTLSTVNFKVEERSQTLQGEPMLLDLVCYAQELLDTYLSSAGINESVKHNVSLSPSDKSTSNFSSYSKELDNDPNEFHVSSSIEEKTVVQDSEVECEDMPRTTTLLQLDHMRSKQSYVKLIKKWTVDLGLGGRLLFFGKFIFIILQGESQRVKDYIIRNRTMVVDVDSKGRPCKERMLSVLCETTSESISTFHEFEVIDNISSFEEFTTVFQSFSMSDAFKACIEPIRSVKLTKKSSSKKLPKPH